MDPTTARLAVQLQLADIDDLLDDLYDSIEITDKNTRASFRVLQTDLRSQLEVLEGQILTLKILKDEHDERVAFKKLMTQERQAVSDHQLAMRLAGLATTDPEFKRSDDYDASLQEEAEDDSCSRWQQAKEAYETALDPHFMDQRSAKFVVDTSDTKISTKPTDDVTMCVACMEAVPVTATLTLACEPEAHTYCRACLEDLFSSSIVNTDLFPPRCCKIPIPIEICRAILPKDLVKDFDLKIEELAIPNPTYCSNANCSKFIRPNKITADIATCVYCHQKTCVRCKATQHNGLCPEDPHVQLLLDAAKRGKWQQCTNCKNMVELDYGCFHMLCRCKHQFCYLCGVTWKQCRCPQWDENSLTRPPNAAPENIAAVNGLVGDIPHVHGGWRRQRGPECHQCGATLPFVMRCNGCDLHSCWRCIRNH